MLDIDIYQGSMSSNHHEFESLTRMITIKKTDVPAVGEHVEDLEIPYTVGGDVKWYNPLEKSVSVS